MVKFEYRELTESILKKIILDGVEFSPSIKKVGLIGSYARNTQTKTSDVDLIIDIEDHLFNNMLSEFGRFVEHILDYQFNKKLDIVRYNLARKRAFEDCENLENWYFREGYEQMLREVRWLYER